MMSGITVLWDRTNVQQTMSPILQYCGPVPLFSREYPILLYISAGQYHYAAENILCFCTAMYLRAAENILEYVLHAMQYHCAAENIL
jgi:hypothetical protein